MLRYLSRVSLWLAAFAAAASLFTPGRESAALAVVAMIALVGALVLRRFKSLAETGEVPTLAHNPTTRDDPDPYGAFE